MSGEGNDNKVEAQNIQWPDSQKTNTDDGEKEEEIEAILSIIPKPFEFDEETSTLIRLLADIENFGDHREIPFLTNLLSEEYRPLIRERIRDVIYGIEKAIDSEEGTSRHSIFEQLFEHSDTETKLLLIDEMIAIGDENEVNFLMQLINESNIVIQKKAKTALKVLKERLSKENPTQIEKASFVPIESLESPLGESDEEEELLTFTDEFILEDQSEKEPNQEVKGSSTTNLSNTLLAQMISLPNKLLARLNG